MNDLIKALQHYQKISRLDGIQGLLWWDMETMMPEGVAPERGEQLGVLAGIVHNLWSDEKFLESVKNSADAYSSKPQSLEKRQIQRLELEVERRRCLSEEFVVRESKLQADCQNQWKEARASEDFSKVEKALAELVGLAREKTQRLKESKALKTRYQGLDSYSILFDAIEPGFRSQELSSLFLELEKELVAKFPKIMEKQSSSAPDLRMALPEQRKLLANLPQILGLSRDHSRMDESTHPFCGGARGDVRITTRYLENDFSDSMFSVIHETGHGLYEQNIPKELWHTPVGTAASIGIHESQSRFFENQIGRSDAFCEYLSVRVDRSPEELKKAFRRVKKGYIRVAADEVTYNFHVLLRWRLETKLINGGLEVRDLPAAWRESFEKLLGLKIEKESQGCLQDIHWYGGAFAYFPTYTIGNLLAAELYGEFKKAHPNWEDRIAKGDFEFAKNFMKTRIHDQAALQESPDTMKKALGGRALGVKAFLNYLDERYL
jgi:carboxypeptidase Taq